jgi:hypothetical protein
VWFCVDDSVELVPSGRSDWPEPPRGDDWGGIAMDATGTWLARVEIWKEDGTQKREVVLWETLHPLTEKWRAPVPRDISDYSLSLAVSSTGQVTLHDEHRGESVLLSARGEEEKRWRHDGRLLCMAGGSHVYAVKRGGEFVVQVRDEEGEETTLQGWKLGGDLSVCVRDDSFIIVTHSSLHSDLDSLTIFRGGAGKSQPLSCAPNSKYTHNFSEFL